MALVGMMLIQYLVSCWYCFGIGLHDSGKVWVLLWYGVGSVLVLFRYGFGTVLVLYWYGFEMVSI